MPYLVAAFFLSGASTLLFESLWIRRATLSVGSSPASFALVSSLAIFGLGIGVLLFPRRSIHRRAPPWATP
ncbi:MAG TPA: hypothetical protein VF847_01075, partial [Candidatus Deferrimicrobiaceae bacterium]